MPPTHAKSLQFEDSGNISGIISAEGEELDFIQSVNPADMAVEWWLLECESVIKQTLHQLAGEALSAYAVTPRAQWILEWAGQLVLNCSQVCWTQVDIQHFVLFAVAMSPTSGLHSAAT